MAITFVNSGTIGSGTTSVTPAYNASVTADNLALLVVVNKYPPNGPTTPAGWTLVGQASGGSGSAGADAGDVYITVFKRVLDGTETGTVTVTITSGNSATSQIYQFLRSQTDGSGEYTPSDGWVVDMVSGTDVTAGTAWSAAASAGIEIGFGDVLLAICGVNTNLYTSSSVGISIPEVSALTVTMRADFGSAAGDNVRQSYSEIKINGSRRRVISPVYTATLSGTAGDAPAGVTAFVRIREDNFRMKWR